MTDVRAARAAHLQENPLAVPCGVARSQPFAAELRAKKVEFEGRSYYKLEGYASVVEQGYEMWDMFGPYTEVVDREAFARTLDSSPDVAFLVNHRGVTMARSSKEGRLSLSADDYGLKVVALVNAGRQDVKDMITAIEDGDISEMSFAFQINRGQWSPDYDEFRIKEVDLDRGDVSAVNYGANPYTSIAARSAEILESLDHLPAGAAQAAMRRLGKRSDIGPEPDPDIDSDEDEQTEVREKDEADGTAEATAPPKKRESSSPEERARMSWLAVKTAYPEMFGDAE